jgi:hypothetical protein
VFAVAWVLAPGEVLVQKLVGELVEGQDWALFPERRSVPSVEQAVPVVERAAALTVQRVVDEVDGVRLADPLADLSGVAGGALWGVQWGVASVAGARRSRFFTSTPIGKACRVAVESLALTSSHNRSGPPQRQKS